MSEDIDPPPAAEMVEREVTNFERLAEHLGESSLARALLDAWTKERSPAALLDAMKTFNERTNAQRPAQ